MMVLNDMTDMDFDEENDQIEQESESLVGMMVHGPGVGAVDESFLDTAGGVSTDPGNPEDFVPPADPAQTQPPTGTIGAGGNMPVTVTPHRRGSPNPLKRKVGKKGASAK